MAADFNKALAFIVGEKNVIPAAGDQAAPYHDLFGYIANRGTEIVSAVLPGSVEEVQAAVRLIRKKGLGLWSTPNTRGNGAVIARDDRPGLIIDLQRMNKILEVDATSACALVEPGVSYRQLYEYLTEKQIPLWIDCDRDPGNSIVGSICSRQMGYTPYGDHLMMQSGMEIVLGDGQLMRTGMGALPKSDTWQLFKYNFGPYWDGMFTQSDMMIVTKAGFWLMPQPSVYMPFMVTLPGHTDLNQAVELLRPLKINSVIPNTVAVTNGVLDLTSHQQRGELIKDGRPDRDAIKAKGFGAWNIYGALYGIRDNVDLTWQAVATAFNSIDGAKIHLQQDRTDDPVWRDRRDLMQGKPLTESRAFSGWGGSQFMTLTAAAPMEGDAAMRMHDIASGVVSEHGLDYLSEFLLPGRVLLKYIYLPYERKDAASRENAVNAGRNLIDQLTRAGYGIVHESLELRHIADSYYQGTPLDDLIARIRSGIVA